jgi:hypothetical protein
MTRLFPHLDHLSVNGILRHYGFTTEKTETLGRREIVVEGHTVFVGRWDTVLGWLADVVAGVGR